MSGSHVGVVLLDRPGIAEAQKVVTSLHYLRRPVDARCSVEGYAVHLADQIVGYLLFGRPEATKVRGWYGPLWQWKNGSVPHTYWQVLNLARVWLDPTVQPGGELHPQTPGFRDRNGTWRSTLASTAIRLAAERIRVEYLQQRPPCLVEEPYQLAWLLSYCDRRHHRGAIYRGAGFELYRPHEPAKGRWIETWRLPLSPLSEAEDDLIRTAAAESERSKAHRDQRRAAGMIQLTLPKLSTPVRRRGERIGA